MRFILIPLACLFTTSLFAQPVNWKNVEAQNADNILIDPAKPPVQTLLLGSFHFGYPNLDAHKTDSSQMIDVLSPSRQKEIRQLVDVVALFKPTKIYIESKNQRRTDSLYNAYLAGTYKLDRDERDQIAFRLAAELKLPKLYAVDARDFTDDYYDKSKVFDSLFKSGILTDSARDRYFNKRYKMMYDAGDSGELKNTILESFLVMAESLTLRRMHGHYLIGGFNTTTQSGPDQLLLWWYSRNLRIYNNILNTRPASGDRILVLFGNGHIPILKHCFESSPEFELVPLKQLVLKMEKAGKLK